MSKTWALAAVAAASLLAACASPPPQPPRADITNSGAERLGPNIVSKTFSGSVGDVRVAVLKSLLRMDVKVVADGKTDQGWRIMAMADDLDIMIQLETLNSTTTRMRIVVGHGGKGWDEKFTEIVLRTWTAPASVSQTRPA